VEGNKPTQRLLAAIAYNNGLTQTELAEWYDVQRRTIYSWLKRLETDESLEQAVADTNELGENESYHSNSKPSSKKLLTSHLKQSRSTRRRSFRNTSPKPTMSSTQSRVAGGC
jgi:predicted DNA-binding protein YlxM (UPF0122 family)